MTSAPSAQTQASYREVYAERSFRILFLTRSLGTIADALRALALSVLIFAATGSPLLGALAYSISFLPQLIGGSLFGALVDRIRPRRLIATGYAAESATAALIAVAHLPAWAILTLVAVISCLTPIFIGASSRVIADVLTGDAYVLGRSLSNVASYMSQLLGLAGGGVAVSALGERHALLVSAVCHLTASVWIRLRLPNRQVLDKRLRGESLTPLRQSWRGNVLLLRDRATRVLLLAQWLPPMFVTGAEGIIVPYTRERGFPPTTAGWLLACLPVGMIVGNITVSRFLRPAVRERLVVPLIAVLACPLLPFAWNLPWPIDAALLVITGTGFSYGLGVQRRFRDVVPASNRGQAFTLLSTGLMSLQGIGPALCGAAAEILPAGRTIALTGVMTLLTALILGLRLPSVLAER
jgi:predicted MFS family arabinose efflux permease